MAEGTHLAAHPDENLLTAFVEHSLTPTERQSVLEHLSACARCRDVVFLAQQAFSETSETGDQQEVAAHRGHEGRRWLRWGSLGAAGALAVLLIAVPIAVYKHRMHKGGAIAVQEIRNEVPPATPPAAQPDLSVGLASNPGAGEEIRRKLEAKRASPALAAARPHAEGTAEIAGSVADRSGAAVPGAHVTVRGVAGGDSRTVVTNPQGQFDVASLPSGKYKVEVQAPGFQMFTQPVTVQPSERASLDAKLDVGAASQTVTVSAANDAGVIGGLVSGSGATGGLIVNGKRSNVPSAGRAPAADALSVPPAKAATAPAAPAPPAPVTGGPVVGRSESAPAVTFVVKDGVVQRCLGSECAARPLPSGAQAVSVAAGGQTVMALDADGNVFVSDFQSLSSDQDASWTPATVQWVGKAVGLRVEAIPSPSAPRGAFLSGAMHGAVAAKSAPAPAPRGATFELTNDKGQIWVSSDAGRTWKTK